MLSGIGPNVRRWPVHTAVLLLMLATSVFYCGMIFGARMSIQQLHPSADLCHACAFRRDANCNPAADAALIAHTVVVPAEMTGAARDRAQPDLPAASAVAATEALPQTASINPAAAKVHSLTLPPQIPHP